MSIKELRTVADQNNTLLIHDIGSGLVVENKFLEKNNIDFFNNEQRVQDSLEDGADLVMFSGDKLFGSVQAGVIAGRKELTTLIKESPLFRTYRCSPVITYELQKTTNLYLSKDESSIPFWSFIILSFEQLEKRLQVIASKLNLQHSIKQDFSLIGGGSMPDVKIPSPVISIDSSISGDMLIKLSSLDVPIIPRVKDNKVIFDIRSSFQNDDEKIIDALNNL